MHQRWCSCIIEADRRAHGGMSPPRYEGDEPLRTVDSKSCQVSLPSFITVTGPETNFASACMGLGLIQAPRYRAAAELATGRLVEVLAQFPPSALPVHVLYSHTRQLSPLASGDRLHGRAVQIDAHADRRAVDVPIDRCDPSQRQRLVRHPRRQVRTSIIIYSQVNEDGRYQIFVDS